MPISHSDIRRYNFNQAFLLNASKQVINDLGCHIQQEIYSNTAILISKINGSSYPQFTVAIYRGYITLNCECDSELENYHWDQTLVNRFIQTLDKHFKEMPQEQLYSQEDSFGRALKLA